MKPQVPQEYVQIQDVAWQPFPDAFSEGGGYVFFADGSWVDAEEYWSRKDSVTEKAANRNKDIEELFRMSNLILQSDYFAS